MPLRLTPLLPDHLCFEGFSRLLRFWLVYCSFLACLAECLGIRVRMRGWVDIVIAGSSLGKLLIAVFLWFSGDFAGCFGGSEKWGLILEMKMIRELSLWE